MTATGDYWVTGDTLDHAPRPAPRAGAPPPGRNRYLAIDPRVGHPPVEVGDQVSGPVRHGGFRPFDLRPARSRTKSGIARQP